MSVKIIDAGKQCNKKLGISTDADSLTNNIDYKKWAGPQLLELTNQLPTNQEVGQLEADELPERYRSIHQLLNQRFGVTVESVPIQQPIVQQIM